MFFDNNSRYICNTEIFGVFLEHYYFEFDKVSWIGSDSIEIVDSF